MSNFETLLVEAAGSVVTVTINRPTKLNALNAQVLQELGDAVARLGTERDAKVVVLRGAGGKAFVAGADIAAMAGMSVLEGHECSTQSPRCRSR
jgi:enoyl-CoA hydratase